MHLANGTLANEVCTATAALSTAAVVYAGYRARAGATSSRLVKAAAGSGIVFLAQMVDVPLFGSVGVHMIGAAFLTTLAGPALATLGMTTVIVLQALLLNDGGITALGANVLNMAVVAVATAAVTARLLRTRAESTPALLAATMIASAASVMAAVAAMSIELALSGTPAPSAFGLTMPAHASIAAWETFTTLVLVVLAARLRFVEPVAVASASR
jgi:cobalt/nickel transport system permease protein